MSASENHKESPGTVVCIIRHGETDWNSLGKLQGREDVELNERGRTQAAGIAGFLKTEPWDLIFSSPLKRAYETAAIIADSCGIPSIRIVDDLVERDYGSASGLLPEERRLRFPDGIPDHEDFEHLRRRAMSAITRIAEECKGKRVLVVTHGALTNSILFTLSEGAFGSFKTRLKNGCLNMIIIREDRWRVEYYNRAAGEPKAD